MIHQQEKRTFRAESLGRFIQRHGIGFRYRETPGYMPGDPTKHFYVELTKDGRMMGIRFARMFKTQLPSLKDALEVLAVDAYLYEAVGQDPVQWHEWVLMTTRPKQAERWYFDQVADMVRGLMYLLGEYPYEELLELVEKGNL